MITMIQQKQPRMPICIVLSSTYLHKGGVMTFSNIPHKVDSIFKSIRLNVSSHVHTYYCYLIMALHLSYSGTIQQIVNRLRNSFHRTNHGEFLCRSVFDGRAVVQTQALAMLKHSYKKYCKYCLLIIDDSQTIKHAKKIQMIWKAHGHASGKYYMGHTILKACLYYRGITITLESWFYSAIVRYLCLPDPYWS